MSIWIAPLVVGGIGAILALTIAIIDAIVNNYGEVKIDINRGKKILQTKGGASLLSALSEQEVFIPSACGGRGSCGACKITVLSDIGPILPTEYPLLTPQEQQDGIRLSCQIKLKANIQIQIPEELFIARPYLGVIDSLNDVTHDIKEVRISLEKPASIEYQAGQYVQLVIPPYRKIPESTQRAYSMSSNPSQPKTVELLIRRVPNGIATTYVHELLKEGQSIELIGPFGDFYVRDTDADMICVAGGSGMAPIKSILMDLFEKGDQSRHIWYFFGARSKRDLFYLDLFGDLEERWPLFHFIPALSDPLPEDEWKGETGLITDVLDEYLRDRVDSDHAKEGYLCGSPGMINACVQVMKNNGIPEDRIYYDKFA